MRFFGITLTTSERRPPGLTPSGDIDAVKLRCGVLRATMTSAASGALPMANSATMSAAALPRCRGRLPPCRGRPSDRPGKPGKRLLDLLFEAAFVARIEAVLFRENLTTGIQQVMRGRHPDLVVVRRRTAAEQDRNGVPVPGAPLRNQLPFVRNHVDPDH